jgi:hypothetical protein
MVHAMSDFHSDLNNLVTDFVTQISALARQAAIQTLERALGTTTAQRGRAPKHGAKRTSDALEALSDTFVAFVAKHPGLRIEQINAELGTKTKELAGSVRMLIADGAIKTKGQKRSRTYFAA